MLNGEYIKNYIIVFKFLYIILFFRYSLLYIGFFLYDFDISNFF